nr:MAG TPA: hypothetical protein [Caudoviricetes sp.]
MLYPLSLNREQRISLIMVQYLNYGKLEYITKSTSKGHYLDNSFLCRSRWSIGCQQDNW